MRKLFLIMGLTVVCLTGCSSAAKHRADVRDDSGDRVTVGTVQREIKVGMSGADVVAALGSPNMVTSDSQRRETWVYDKVATEHVASGSKGGGGLFIVGGGSTAGASTSSQRTLTIIIKFDENGTVRDYSYRQSSF